MLTPGAPRRAAVLGSPVEHSRSPDLHRAAYAALGLTGWTYDRIETTAQTLPRIVGGSGPEWIGFSVTMPAKKAALAFADERSERAEQVGSANTLVRTARGWRADCTDIDGMAGALREAGLGATGLDTAGPGASRAVLLGAGGTALPSVAALADAGIAEVTVVARSAERAREVLDLCGVLGLRASVVDFAPGDDLRRACDAADVTVSTVPAAGAATVAASVAGTPRLVDAIYDPWPTPLAAAVAAAGGTVVGGQVMLLNQAYSQVEQFTGLPAPRAAMAAALP